MKAFSAACALGLLGLLASSAVVGAPTSSGPSWSDPQGLCNAIVYMPTKGWHNGGSFLGWFCQSELKQYGAVGPRGLPSTFQFDVTGTAYHKATTIELRYNANNPATRTKSLQQMGQYAKVLSDNVAFKLSTAQLRKIAHGQSFAASAPQASVKFTVAPGPIHVYTLSISAK